MIQPLSLLLLCGTALAAHPFLEFPDTGLDTFLGDVPAEASGTLIPLEDIITIPDFQFAAQTYMSSDNFSYYRTGAAGEYSEYAATGRYMNLLTSKISLPIKPGYIQ